MFLFTPNVNYTFVKNVVIGRSLIDNCLMRIMHFMHGELVSMNGYVLGVHQGFEGYKNHQMQMKAKQQDMYWNHEVIGKKYIIHQGTLRLPDRKICRVLELMIMYSGI